MTTSPGVKRVLTLVAIAAVTTCVGVLIAIFTPPKSDFALHLSIAQSVIDEARTNRTVPLTPPDILLPIPDVSDPGHRKTLFIAALLPGIVRENARLEDQRARAQVAPKGSPEYTALAYAYGLAPEVTRQKLLSHIDIVPESLTLAQGAIESAWGTSRFAREGNAFFGERTYDADADGLVPLASQTGGFKVKSFPRPDLSVRSFMKTINTHRAYQPLRNARAAMRKEGQRPTGLALAQYLHRYSEIGDAYVRRVTITIKTNDFATFNGLEIRRDE